MSTCPNRRHLAITGGAHLFMPVLLYRHQKADIDHLDAYHRTVPQCRRSVSTEGDRNLAAGFFVIAGTA